MERLVQTVLAPKKQTGPGERPAFFDAAFVSLVGFLMTFCITKGVGMTGNKVAECATDLPCAADAAQETGKLFIQNLVEFVATFSPFS